ncbi:hypothetical protein V6Z11_A05G086400 [Gossypium hirsutum]
MLHSHNAHNCNLCLTWFLPCLEIPFCASMNKMFTLTTGFTCYVFSDKQAYPRHSLSRAALISSGSPIFFLDAFTTLIVFYSSTADPSLPFPPPNDWFVAVYD